MVKAVKQVSGSKASAGVKNVGDGMRLALAFIKDAEEAASQDAAVQESRKEKLSKLVKLSMEEHNAFCAHMNEKREGIKAAAKAAGFEDLQKYFTTGGKDGVAAQVVQVTVSLWIKCSVAAANGWRPDLKKAWSVLSAEATKYKKSVAAGPTKVETDAERKLREAAEQVAVVKKATSFVTSNMMQGEGEKATLTPIARSALPDIVASYCMHASIEELDAIIARITEMRATKVTSIEEAKKAVSQASSGKKGEGMPPAKTTERAQAKGNQRTRAKA